MIIKTLKESAYVDDDLTEDEWVDMLSEADEDEDDDDPEAIIMRTLIKKGRRGNAAAIARVNSIYSGMHKTSPFKKASDSGSSSKSSSGARKSSNSSNPRRKSIKRRTAKK